MSESYEELQKKQLFAQRVTAVSSVATAVASHRAAASLEAMRQDASDVAVATIDHQIKMQEMQEAQLSVIEKQARAEAKDREYQRQVLFLKESDNDTKLETFFEMIKEKLFTLYVDPDNTDLPEEVRDNGSLTRKLKLLTASKPEYNEQPLPERGIRLKDEIQKIKTEIISNETILKNSRFGFLGVLGIVIGIFLVFCGIAAITHIVIKDEWDKTDGIGIIFFIFSMWLVGGGWLLHSQISKLIRSKKRPAIENQLCVLNKNQYSLNTELKPLLEQVSEVNSRAKKEAEEKHFKTIKEYLERWQSIMFGALIQHYFDQGLWIESGGFTQRLKAALTDVQKPFPTSCRVDVNKLQPNQIATAYQSFTELVAHRMCAQDIMPARGTSAREAKILEILRRDPSAQAKPNAG